MPILKTSTLICWRFFFDRKFTCFNTLNNKNWSEVVKGKLIDLALGKLVENDTLKYIYKELTNQTLQLF